MRQRFHGLASMANTCRAFSTKHDHKPEAYATSARMANTCRAFGTKHDHKPEAYATSA